MKVTLEKIETAIDRFISEYIGNLANGDRATQFLIGMAKEEKKPQMIQAIKCSSFYDEADKTVDISKMENAINAGFKMSGGSFPVPFRVELFGITVGGDFNLSSEAWTAFKRYL